MDAIILGILFFGFLFLLNKAFPKFGNMSGGAQLAATLAFCLIFAVIAAVLFR